MRKSNIYPQWFVDDLYLEEDKQKARSGLLKKTDKVQFFCKKKHIYTQIVSNHIYPDGTQRSKCPICTKLDRQLNRKYPEWFIDELINEEDKQKALSGSLTSCDRVKIRCTKCGYEYETKVGTHICLKTMQLRRGCKECAREKHRQDRINYIKNNYNKVCASNQISILKQKQYYQNNPHLLTERGEKRSLYLKNHPDEIESFINRIKEWRENHPDEVKQNIENNKVWRKEHGRETGRKISESLHKDPSILKNRGLKYKELCETTDLRKKLSLAQKKSNIKYPSLAKERGIKVSLWYKNNPDKVKEKTRKFKQTLVNDPSIKERISFKLKAYYKNKEWKYNKYKALSYSFYKRRITLLSENFKKELEQILSPDDYSLFLSGKINSKSFVRVKCPKCGIYSKHKLFNVCSIENNRLDSIPYCPECLKTNFSSKEEKEIKTYISGFYTGSLIENSREIIPPYELDLYYPDLNIAIEYNGSFWHSEKCCTKNKHYLKYNLCKQKNMRLVSIYSYDWLYRRDKIENFLKNLFLVPKRIYARTCVIKEVSELEAKDFLNTYSIFKERDFSFSYGLFYKEELIAIFSLLKIENNKYEIVNLVYKNNYIVIGGSKKLFTHFVKDYDPICVFSLSNNDFFSGNAFSHLGFSLVNSNIKHILYVKYKSVIDGDNLELDNLGNKYLIYKEQELDGSTIDLIMKDLKYNKIYCCGYSKWVWFNN